LQRFVRHVDLAAGGAEAIEMALKQNFDMVFMDCQMPGMDGYETTVKLRRMEGPARNTLVIALTADAMPGSRERCLEAGMNDYATKPLNTNDLQAVLQLWLSPSPIEASGDEIAEGNRCVCE